MDKERLNGLALMYAHHDVGLNLDAITDLFATQHQRRMRMVDMLFSNDT